ncbi:hypothetical protein AB1K70_22020 [Bremerella sp. JC770]|uniref:hypothetical protein n=1 Tax=Bremerella sp. JC770 TaxID=3232137 RepID=UPI00345AFFCD
MSSSQSEHEAIPSESPPPKPRSWRVRWSLRGLIALVTLCCLLSGWAGYQIRVGYTHEDVGNQIAIQTNLVRVKWRYQGTEVEELPAAYQGSPHATRPAVIVREVGKPPAWMQRMGVSRVFQRIESIRFPYSLPQDQFDATIQQVSRLDHVEALKFSTMNFQQQLSQRDLETLLTHVHVEEIYAPYCPLDGGPIPALRASRLTYLELSHSWFGDAAAADLPTTLTWLDLERTAVTDAGLSEFTRLRRLESLNLKRTPTSEAAIEKLRSAMPWCEIQWEPLTRP